MRKWKCLERIGRGTNIPQNLRLQCWKRALVSLPWSRYTALSYLWWMVSKVSYSSLSCWLWMEKRKSGSSGRAKQRMLGCLCWNIASELNGFLFAFSLKALIFSGFFWDRWSTLWYDICFAITCLYHSLYKIFCVLGVFVYCGNYKIG